MKVRGSSCFTRTGCSPATHQLCFVCVQSLSTRTTRRSPKRSLSLRRRRCRTILQQARSASSALAQPERLPRYPRNAALEFSSSRPPPPPHPRRPLPPVLRLHLPAWDRQPPAALRARLPHPPHRPLPPTFSTMNEPRAAASTPTRHGDRCLPCSGGLPDMPQPDQAACLWWCRLHYARVQPPIPRRLHCRVASLRCCRAHVLPSVP